VSHSGFKARKSLVTIAVAVVVAVGMFVLPSFGDACGDYDRADAEDILMENTRIEEGNDGHSYEYEPGDGDYRKTGAGEFEYVGCSDGSHGSGGWFTTGGSHRSGGSDGTSGGSGFRGGGPGFGK